MDRMACVNLPAFPLQLLIKRHPEWKNQPAAVVEKDKPLGIILWVNSKARRHRILPGMKYAHGLSLSVNLRAGVVSAGEIEASISELAERLRFYTPHVEPSKDEPGIFWLDASGLSLLYPSLKKWAGLIGEELSTVGYYWTLAVGHTRFGTYAATKVTRRIIVFEDPDEERTHARDVSIERLKIDPKVRDALTELGITRLGDFIALPSDGIRKRFGEDAHRLYRLARGELFAPIEPVPPEQPFVESITLDYPEKDVPRLLAIIEMLLDSLFVSLEERGRLLSSIAITLVLDDRSKKADHLCPADPTLDARQILGLIRLRFEKYSLSSGVTELTLEAAPAKAKTKQLELFRKKPKRNLEAADRAFARLRALFGDDAVMKAHLREGHLPEARFEWERLEHLSAPKPRRVKIRPLIRRILTRPMSLPSRADHSSRDRFIPGIPDGSVRELVGPYVVSGGWWLRRVHREYYFARTSRNRWLWIYYDRMRRRFFMQGAVE